MAAPPTRRGSASRRYVGPFGAIEDRELRTLAELEAPLIARHLVSVLRTREDGASGWCRDGLGSLAWLCGCSEATVRRGLSWLRRSKIILERREPQRGGRQGAAWSWPRRALPYDEWPVRKPRESTLRGPSPADSVIKPTFEELLRRKAAGLPIGGERLSLRAPLLRGEALKSAGRSSHHERRDAHFTRDSPNVSPEISPDESLTRSERRVAGMRHIGGSLDSWTATVTARANPSSRAMPSSEVGRSPSTTNSLWLLAGTPADAAKEIADKR